MLTSPSPNDQLSEPKKLNPWNPVQAILRCWRWALPLGIVLAGVTAVVIFSTFVPTYRAMHLLEANRDFLVFDNVMPTIDDLAATERALFYNPLILDRVLEDPDVLKAPSLSDPATAEQNLVRNLVISNGGTRSRLEVSYIDTDGESAALVCNAIVESYLDRRDAFDEKRVSNLEKWLEPEILNWEKVVADHIDRVQTLSKLTMGYSPVDQWSRLESDADVARATHLKSRISDVSLETEILDAQIELNKKNSNLESKSDSDQERSLAASEAIRKRELLAAELSVLKRHYEEQRLRLEQFGGATAQLQFAKDEFEVANDVLMKLRNRAAAIRTERRQDGAVRSLARATPPKDPVQQLPYAKAVWSSLAAFLAPFLLGFLLGFRSPTQP